MGSAFFEGCLMPFLLLSRFFRPLLYVSLMLIASFHAVAASTSVTLQLRWWHQFQFAGYYAALHKGFYAEAGLNVELLEGGPGINVVEQVTSKKADFGVSNASLLIDYLQGKPVLMLGPIFQHSPNIVIARGSGMRLTDLVDAGPVALMGGDQDVELKAMFLNEGIALDRVRFVPDERHLTDFLEQKVLALNAYSSNEPFILNQAGIAHTVLNPENYGMDFYGDALFTHPDMETTNAATLRAFRSASLRGWEYALKHPEEIIEVILQHYNTQNKSREHLLYEANAIENLVNPSIISVGHNNPGRWQHIAQTYARFGLIDDVPIETMEGFFYQPERPVDLGWLYATLLVAVTTLVIVGGIAGYILFVNRRLNGVITEKTAIQTRLIKSEARHRIVFETSPSAGLTWCGRGIITDWNHQAEILFGWTREEVLGRCFMDFMLPETTSRTLHETLEGFFDKPVLPHHINENRCKDGRILICEWFNAWLPPQPGQPREAVSLAIDVTERNALECAREERLAFLRKLTASVPGTIFQYRLYPEGATQYIAIGGEELPSEQEWVGPSGKHALFSNAHPEECARLEKALRLSAKGLEPLRITYRADGTPAHEQWYEVHALPEIEADGVILWNGYISDVTEHQKMLQEIHQIALYDPLTKLPNRRLFHDRLEQALSACQREARYGALMFLDLDNFKPLNDTYGHEIGDILLVEVAQRLLACVRDTDTVARLGGDEFVVLLRALDPHFQKAEEQAEKLGYTVLARLSEPYELTPKDPQAPKVEHMCSASIGIVLFGSGENPEYLLKKADMAMYEAKAAGRRTVRKSAPISEPKNWDSPASRRAQPEFAELA
jgi:diguanylate cyclase (GGDEF)-like protein/PAS domain S-box-containing protein